MSFPKIRDGNSGRSDCASILRRPPHGKRNSELCRRGEDFPELQDRIAKTVAYLKPFNPFQFDGSAERIITMNIRRKPVTLDGKTYLLAFSPSRLLAFSLPNFFFHVTTAYDILRHKGLEIGKMDYLGGF